LALQRTEPGGECRRVAWGEGEIGLPATELGAAVGAGPGLIIMVVVLGVNLLGDTLRDILDPRSVKVKVR